MTEKSERPETFHGTPPFYVETGNRIELPNGPSWGHIMADTLAEMSRHDSRIVAITAAMKLGTGLDHYAEHYPEPELLSQVIQLQDEIPEQTSHRKPPSRKFYQQRMQSHSPFFSRKDSPSGNGTVPF